MTAPLPVNEARRLLALESYNILDTSPEQGFDDLVLLASQICETPIALVSLVAGERQWFKSRIGLEAEETPRELSFCAHALLQPDDVFHVPDARTDARFSDNALVTGEQNIQFYAGAPLVTPDGDVLGTLCVLDNKPRELSPSVEKALRALARQAVNQLEMRRNLMRLSDALAVRVQVEGELRESESRFEAFMDHSPLVAFLKDSGGRYVYVNKPFLDRFNMSREQVIGRNDFELWPKDIAQNLRDHDARVVAGQNTVELIERVPTPDGEKYWQAFKFPLQQGGGKGRFLAGVALDVTQTKQYEQQLERYQQELENALSRVEAESRSDALTGLNNRRAFNPKLEEEFDRARRYGSPLSILMLDVDKFKRFNDSFGHGSGDEVLQTVARLLAEKARVSDFVARLGGEEFAVLLPNTGAEGAFILAERIRRTMETTSWQLRSVTASIGIATFDSSSKSGAELLDQADKALYEAKERGRNRVVHFCSEP